MSAIGTHPPSVVLVLVPLLAGMAVAIVMGQLP